jgi:hypothetical protein
VVPYTLWNAERSNLPKLSYNLFEQSGAYTTARGGSELHAKLLEWLEQK